MLAISPQDVDSHARWAEAEGFQFPLLADTDQEVATSYGVASARMGVKRSVFLIDAEGILRAKHGGAVRAIFKKPKALAKALADI